MPITTPVKYTKFHRIHAGTCIDCNCSDQRSHHGYRPFVDICLKGIQNCRLTVTFCFLTIAIVFIHSACIAKRKAQTLSDRVRVAFIICYSFVCQSFREMSRVLKLFKRIGNDFKTGVCTRVVGYNCWFVTSGKCL
jgi:hypothetical protein